MSRYLLDTNTVRRVVRRTPALDRRITEVPIAALCISAVTTGELRFGLARRPGAVRLRATVMELVKRVDTLAWDSAAAERHGELRAGLERLGRPLGSERATARVPMVAEGELRMRGWGGTVRPRSATACGRAG